MPACVGIFELGCRGQRRYRVDILDTQPLCQSELQRSLEDVAERASASVLEDQRAERDENRHVHEHVIFPPGQGPDWTEDHRDLREAEQQERDDKSALEGQMRYEKQTSLAPG